MKKPRVGMVKAMSPSLAPDGVFIGVFTNNSVCIFFLSPVGSSNSYNPVPRKFARGQGLFTAIFSKATVL